MKWSKWTISAASLAAMCACFGTVMDDPENSRAIREYIEKTRAINIQDKDASLKLGGEVRVGHIYIQDKVGGQKMTGRTSGPGFPDYDPSEIYAPTASTYFPIKARLSLEYDKNETYAHTLLQFDNFGGINKAQYDVDGGRLFYDETKPGGGGIKLARAVYGYRFLDEDGQKLALELGRRQMDDVFLSPIQYDSNFDGVLLRYENSELGLGRFKVDAGTFIIDNRTYHFGHALQVGTTIPENGIFANYSLINWYKDGKYADIQGTWGRPSKAGLGESRRNYEYRFMNSQAMLGIALPHGTAGKIMKVYAGGLVNHKARPTAKSGGKKENVAYFANAEYGEAERTGQAGDWKLLASLQQVGAQAVQEKDARAGINGPGQSLPIPYFAPLNDGSYGFGNYKGIVVQGTYAVKEGVLFRVRAAYAQPKRKLGALRQGGKNSFLGVETEIGYYF